MGLAPDPVEKSIQGKEETHTRAWREHGLGRVVDVGGDAPPEVGRGRVAKALNVERNRATREGSFIREDMVETGDM